MLAAGVALAAGFAVRTVQPTFKQGPPTEQTVPAERLRTHVERLSVDFAPRSCRDLKNLNRCADYIRAQLNEAGGRVEEQTFVVRGSTYRNVTARFGPEGGARIVAGAHYDAFRDTPGADDNASGVAGLIELARLLGRTDLKQCVELVAYTLEEPPFFRTADMGSAHHALELKKSGVEVEAMISLEMIGYFSDEKGSQHFPSLPLRMLYPDTGNFIAVIGSTGDRRLAKSLKVSMRGATDLPVHVMCAPRGFPGIDFSDHRNYWNQGCTAVMITDTAFMRNFSYHGDHDTADRLDYRRMAQVVLGVYEGVVRLADGGN